MHWSATRSLFFGLALLCSGQELRAEPDCNGGFPQTVYYCEQHYKFHYPEVITVFQNETLWLKTCYVDNRIAVDLNLPEQSTRVAETTWHPGGTSTINSPDSPVKTPIAQADTGSERAIVVTGYNGPRQPGDNQPNPHDIRWFLYKENASGVMTFSRGFKSHCATNQAWSGWDKPIFTLTVKLAKTQ